MIDITKRKSHVEITTQTKNEIKGGTNFSTKKSFEFVYNALHPAGPVNTDDHVYVPLNVLVAFTEDLVALKEGFDSDPRKKIYRYFKVEHGRDWQDGHGYSNTKSSFGFPFNIVSSSVTTGYNKQVIERVTDGIQITNLHNDVYGPHNEKPMQGPFTEWAVGGHQSRHISLNRGSDNYLTRPEAWKILLGTVTDITGALGMAGADYPWPEANEVGENPYPMTGSQKAVLYRDLSAKRPVNIRNIKAGKTTSLGNFRYNYEVVHTFGAFSNPKNFIKNTKPTLPSNLFENNTNSATQTKTLLDISREERAHFAFMEDYSTSFLGRPTSDSSIVTRFSAPGGIETLTKAFQDFKSSEMSTYNSLNYRNLTVRRPSQYNGSDSVSETQGIVNSHVNNEDYGLTVLSSRHTNKFGRDSKLQPTVLAQNDEVMAFHKVNQNRKKVVISGSGGYSESYKYDNLFVVNSIPRSDLQYSWITGSISNPNESKYYSFGSRGDKWDSFVKLDGDYVSYYDFSTGSEEGAGIEDRQVPTINILNSITQSHNTSSYTTEASSDKYHLLNSILTLRGMNTGYSWTMGRNRFNPLLNILKKNNLYQIAYTGSIGNVEVQPVSTKTKPILINYKNKNAIARTIKATHNLSKTFFGNQQIDGILIENDDKAHPTGDKILEAFRQTNKDVNWIVYEQNIFPSSLNEYKRHARERQGYTNDFWRDTLANRVITGSTQNNSFGANVSQSSWPLDESVSFDEITQLTADAYSEPDYASGELQNVYTNVASNLDYDSLRAGAVLARMHLVSSPTSVVSPTGIRVVDTSSFTTGQPPEIDPSLAIATFGGQARWQAAELAGYITKTGSAYVFNSASSNPWFDSYSDFKKELNLIAKDYAIIPEYRISDKIEEYVLNNFKNIKSKKNEFEIVGTNITSEQDNFYIDFSNSDFLKEFSNISETSETKLKEIKLSCSGIVRFNPYKNFYPAQRTLNLVSQFSKSYGKGITCIKEGTNIYNFEDLADNTSGYIKPLITPLFSPGILFNSIKSGIAVDYPVISEPEKFITSNFDNGEGLDNYMLTTNQISGDSFWDYRVPFEAIIEPEKYINKLKFYDYDSHPSASFDLTASWSDQKDEVYNLMSSNFISETGKFFLKNSEYTALKSKEVKDDLTFESGSVYGARLKIRRSTSGPRTYQYDYDSYGQTGSNSFYSIDGMHVVASSEKQSASIEIPQDPKNNPYFKETFTMYSRTTAFGPEISGRTSVSGSVSGAMDSLNGFNWSFTPPYYHGESWIDFVFRPDHTKKYSLEDILSEIKISKLRVDSGFISGSGPSAQTVLMPGDAEAPHGGAFANSSSMHLDSCVNLFGIERVAYRETDKFNNTTTQTSNTQGKRWVIQPKFETPMLNFNDTQGPRPVNENNGLSVQQGAGSILSSSVPRGIWHQFGTIPQSPDIGIFLEIGDIPIGWLKNHYNVTTEDTVYNNFDAATNGQNLFRQMKSLSDLVGFSRENNKVKLGEIKEKQVVYEAVVAVPYIIESNIVNDKNNPNNFMNKKFFEIPHERFINALVEKKGSKQGDILDTAGESIRDMVSKMKKYVMPPQFDFINNRDINPVSMYLFEFKYELDKDDLSYIWQNLAPRGFDKIEKQTASVAHKLLDNELLSSDDLLNNKNLRWMVFKVKQKSMAKYGDMIYEQVGSHSDIEKNDLTDKDQSLGFNWPYDYLSFVELIKINTSIKMDKKDK